MTTQTPSSSGQRHACFAAMVLLSIAACGRPFLSVAASSLTVDSDALFAFMPAIVVTVIFSERRHIFSEVAFWPSAAAAYGLVVAGELFSPGISLSLLFLSFAFIAAFAICYGPAAAGKALFPLALLLGLTPLPNPWLESAVFFLQHASALATGWFFALADIPFTRQGLVFSLPKLDIEIARECSSIRSSLILLVCGLVLGHFFLRSRWTKAALALSVIPMTVAKNGLRIFTLSVLGMYVDPSFLSGSLHRNGGVLFFAVAIAVLAGLTKLLRKIEGGKALVVPAAALPANPVL